ncbi:MAG: tetratricopeptide repeat protein [Planctomycetes bacterium]|nr:tetratricopeptide repeat protein [Planctomycetota bacterium]
MLHLRNKQLWLVLAPVLLIGAGTAAYQLGWNRWANRQHERALQALDRYDYDEAAECLDRYLSVYPTNPDGLFLAAKTARRRGDIPEAQRRLQLAITHGAAAKAVAKEAQLLDMQDGKPVHLGALLQFCDANKADPQTPIILEAILEGSLKANQLSYAMTAADWLLKMRSRDIDQAHGLVWRGRTFWRGRDWAKALASFRQAVALAPDYAAARIWLASGLIDHADEEAKPHVDWLQEHCPRNVAARLQIARLYRNQARLDEAAALLDEALADAPNNVNVLVVRAQIALDANRATEAAPWIRRAYALTPADRDVSAVMANSLRLAGRADEAKKYQDKVKELDDAIEKSADPPRPK